MRKVLFSAAILAFAGISAISATSHPLAVSTKTVIAQDTTKEASDTTSTSTSGASTDSTSTASDTTKSK